MSKLESFITHKKNEFKSKGIKSAKRSFEIGDIVYMGFQERKFRVIKVLNSYCYVITSDITADFEKYQNDLEGKFLTELTVQSWNNLSNVEKVKETNFASNNRFNINFFKTRLHTFIYRNYSQNDGFIFNAPYQRDYVWTKKEKEELIDSIFKNVDIGKFVLIPREHGYEVLDGKQRITAMIDFYEDGFTYKDTYYSELSQEDKNRFLDSTISLAEPRREMDLKEKYEYFINLNSKGVSMSKEHLDKVVEEYKKIK